MYGAHVGKEDVAPTSAQDSSASGSKGTAAMPSSASTAYLAAFMHEMPDAPD